MEQEGEGLSFGLLEGGAVLFPFLAIFALFVALPFSLGALGLVAGDLGRRLAAPSLKNRTGIVLSAVPVALFGISAVWISLSDRSITGALVLSVICIPMLIGFIAAVSNAGKWIRFGALALGFLVGAAVVIYYGPARLLAAAL